MGCTADFAWTIVQGDDEAASGNIAPRSRAARGHSVAAAHDLATASTLRAARTVFVRFYPEVENAFARKQVVVGDDEVLEPEKSA